ncbi:hypothetical protein ACLOJK_002750 [Asimina triloba]
MHAIFNTYDWESFEPNLSVFLVDELSVIRTTEQLEMAGMMVWDMDKWGWSSTDKTIIRDQYPDKTTHG